MRSRVDSRPAPLGYPDETKREAVRLYPEGVNFRRIGRILSVNPQSVINWSNSYHAPLPASPQSVAAPEVVEFDELFTFVGSKKTLTYVVRAVDRATRCVVAYDMVWERAPEVLEGVVDRAWLCPTIQKRH